MYLHYVCITNTFLTSCCQVLTFHAEEEESRLAFRLMNQLSLAKPIHGFKPPWCKLAGQPRMNMEGLV